MHRGDVAVFYALRGGVVTDDRGSGDSGGEGFTDDGEGTRVDGPFGRRRLGLGMIEGGEGVGVDVVGEAVMDFAAGGTGDDAAGDGIGFGMTGIVGGGNCGEVRGGKVADEAVRQSVLGFIADDESV